MLKNIIKHFNIITKHKLEVFKLCLKAGIPYRGLVHDMSKYSFTEFFESAKFYQGDRSPICKCKEINGYSKAWLHHKGRNKHHPEYWYDEDTEIKEPIIPYKYTVEMICDKLAASKIYVGKNWTIKDEIIYWNKQKENILLNPKLIDMLTEVFDQIDKYGENKVINSKNLKTLYNRYVNS